LSPVPAGPGSGIGATPLVEIVQSGLLGGPLGAPAGPFSSANPIGLWPAQILRAYGIDQISFNGVRGDGSGQTIAIVDAYDNPMVQHDLNAFDAAFGGPAPPSFTKLDEHGGNHYPGLDPTGFWAEEEALDVEWAHAIAPGARIDLVETNPLDLATGVDTARHLPGVTVVSMSWGFPEWAGETALDNLFTTPAGHVAVTFVAGSGDSGAGNKPNYPASSPNVIGVGGTTLTIDGASNYVSERGWSNSGGGLSWYETQPGYQAGIVTQSHSSRAVPDVALNADNVNSGQAIYDSYNYGLAKPWVKNAGTSLATAMWAGLIAIADQGRAVYGLGSMDGRQTALPALYQLPAADFHDITLGNNGYPAGPGYDLVTGRGTPVSNLLIPDLAHPHGVATHFLITPSNNAPLVGSTFSITVTALDAYNNVVPAYFGRIHFTSNDAAATLPADYTFTAADKGMHVFNVTLRTAGTWTITAANIALPAVSGSVTVTSAIFHPGVRYSSGAAYTNAVTMGDFYGDGKLDLVTAGGSMVNLLRGNGDGTFQLAVQIKTPDPQGGADALAEGDFNHDGHLDLVVANYYTNTITVLLGNGNGTFQPGIDYAVGQVPTSIVVGDFNHDGNLDLAVANYDSNSVSVLLGNGDGTFKPAVNYAVNGFDGRIAAGDFSGNGNLDLVTANEYWGAGQTPNTVSVLMGNGDGTFRPAVNYAAGSLPDAVAVRDFNHDGHLDLAVADYGGNTVSVLMGNGDGTFKNPVGYAVGVEPNDVAVADFNGDGNLDLAVLNRNGGGGPTDPPVHPGTVTVLLGNANGTFGNAMTYGVDWNPSTLVAADFNGDGRPDLAVSSRGVAPAFPGNVDVLLNALGGAFARTGTTTTIWADNPSSVFGQEVSFTASVAPLTPGGRLPSGTVQFKIDGMNYGAPVTLVAGSASTGSITTLGGGQHIITAVYSGDANFAPSTGTLPHAVTRTGSTTALSLSSPLTVFGQVDTFTAIVSPATPGLPLPTGAVQFQIDGVNFGAPVTLVGGRATIADSTTLSPGPHTITAIYAGDANFTGSSSSASQTVTQSGSSTTLSSTSPTSVFGQADIFTAVVSPVAPGAGIPTGTVQFQIDGVNFGTPVALQGGTAQSGSISTLTPGPHAINAIYSGDVDFTTSTASLSQTINPANTSTTLSSSNPTSVFGQPDAFTAIVAPVAPGAGTPTGTIQFQIDGINFGTPVALQGGSAQSGSISTLTPGPHAINAIYSGDPDFITSTGTLSQNVNQANSSTALSSATPTSVAGQAVIFTAIVTPVAPGAGTPTGTVQFQIDGVNFGMPVALQGGSAQSSSISTLALGPHIINAVYSSDPDFTASTGTFTQMVHPTTATTTTLWSNGPVSVVGQLVTFTATVTSLSPSDPSLPNVAPTGTIQFQIDGQNFGTPVALVPNINVGGTSPAVASSAQSNGIATLTPGPHAITAIYSGDSNFSGSTGTFAQMVNAAGSSTAVTSDNPISLVGQSVTFTATVTSLSPNTLAPTGTVQFQVDGVNIGGPVTLIGGVASSASLGTLPAGAHTITAQYSGDANFAPSVGTFTQMVHPTTATTTALSSNSPVSLIGQLVTFTATVTSLSTSNPNLPNVAPTGTIQFQIDGQNFGAPVPLVPNIGVGGTSPAAGSSAQSNGIATLTPGPHVITAIYSGDSNFSGSTGAFSQIVAVANSSTAVTSDNPTSVVGQPLTFTATVTSLSDNTLAPTGTVQFQVDGINFGGPVTLIGGVASSASVGNLPAGAHRIMALYSGDANFAPSLGTFTQTVNQDSTATDLSSSNASSVFGQPITFTATVRSMGPYSGPPTGPVLFQEIAPATVGTANGTGDSVVTTLGTAALDSNGQAQLTISQLIPAGHVIQAIYQGDGNFLGSTSAQITQTVSPAETTLDLASSNREVLVGTPLTFTATLTLSAPGSPIVAPTGTITLYDTFEGTTTVIGVLTLGGPLQISPALAVGTHVIQAVYSGDGNFNTSTSGTITQVIDPLLGGL
jgi:hypothetical protein